MARPLDPRADEAITDATLTLLSERGFAAMTMEDVAQRAKVGKPTIYRRFPSKAALVTAVLERQLPKLEDLEVPDLGDTRAELHTLISTGFPPDGPSYVRLTGGLIAEQERHPELIEAYRSNILRPRREITCALIERGQKRGDVRADVEPEDAVDLIVGSFLARVFAGRDTGPAWNKRTFETWWDIIKAKEEP
jgi:AcrR family transcriptional regulator